MLKIITQVYIILGLTNATKARFKRLQNQLNDDSPSEIYLLIILSKSDYRKYQFEKKLNKLK